MEKSIIHKKLHGRVIHYNDLSKTLPSRNRFLNKELHQSVSNKLSNLKPLLFMPNGLWDEKPMQDAEYQKSKYKVVLFGILEDGQRINVILGNIEPYFEVKIPDKDHKGNKIENKTLFGNQLFEIIEGLKVNEKYDGKCQPTHFEVVSGKPFKYYQEDLCYYIRIYFDKTAHRKAAINHIRELKYETVHDDLNCYYRVVCRDYLISYGSWILLDNYNIQDAGTNKYFKDGCINIDVKCLKCMQLSDLKVLYSNEIPEWIPKDYTMTMCWDIETYNADEDGKIPQPEFPNHRMFMIGMTFQWHNSSDQLVRICLVDHPSAPHPDFLTVVCDNEQNLIKAFARCYNKMRADIVMGFNDSGYDWPWIIKRAQKYPGALKYISKMFDACIDKKDLTDKDVLWNYKSLQVKIEATLDVKGNNLQVPGYIPVDVMIIFRQLYPTSEKWGLNYFLEKNKLGGKADMPYQEMFDIYKRLDELVIAGETNGQEFIKLKDKMKLVAEYCVIDSQRCHELMKIRSVVQDRREVAVLSYTSMFDTFYRANGMKVRNLVIGLGQPFGLKFSNIHNQIVESGKYPGAYVFPPIKGLLTSKLSISERIEKGNRGYAEYSAWTELSENEIQICFDYIANNGISNIDNDGIVPNSTLPECMNTMLQESTGRPITGLDFSSLYPSLIMTYNLSPEYIIIDKAYARKIDKMLNIDGSKKHILHKIKFEYNGRTIRGWSVRHDNKLNPNSSDYKFGLFGKILKDLFDTRKVLKKGNADFKGLEYWEHRKEQLKLLSADEFSSKTVQAEFEEVCFQFNALDSKQKALKVFMNTFYGEVGNKSSPLFLLQVAGGITSAGQHNIKSAQKYVENHGCKVYYGDTDSLYETIPETNFIQLDIDYYTEKISKLNYWKEMVRITFVEIKKIQAGVNEWFLRDNGTEFLKMSYEEILFPVLFLAKKKYAGVPHISEPNFSRDVDLFIRGLELKKRGVSDLLKNVCNDILRKCVDSENILTVIEIVQNSIIDFYTREWNMDSDFDVFIMTGVYRPDKKNVKMHTFRDRMIRERNINIKPGERIKYVVVKKYPYIYDDRGRKTALSIGDKMELAEVAKAEGIPIDKDYYMSKSINGQLARLITYHPDFHAKPVENNIANDDQDPDQDQFIDTEYDPDNPNVGGDEATNDELKKIEDEILKHARKYVDGFCMQYYSTYTDQGPLYKHMYKLSSGVVKKQIGNMIPKDDKSTHTTFGLLNRIIPDNGLEEWIKSAVVKAVEKKKINKTYGADYIKSLTRGMEHEKKNKYIIQLQQMYYAPKKRDDNTIIRTCEKLYEERQAVLENRLSQSISTLKQLYATHDGIISDLTNKIKSEFGECPDGDINDNKKLIDNNNTLMQNLEVIAESEINKHKEFIQSAMSELKFIYFNLMGNYEFIFQTRSIVLHLKSIRDTKVGKIKAPTKQELSDFINESIQSNTLESIKENL